MEVSTKGKATFQPRLQDQNVAPSLEGTVKIDIFERLTSHQYSTIIFLLL